jgi:hypothetical protein
MHDLLPGVAAHMKRRGARCPAQVPLQSKAIAR